MRHIAHTKGPWSISDGSPYRVLSVEFNSAGTGDNLIRCDYICDTASNAKTRTPQNAANARPIAAAPELLEALNTLLACAPFLGTFGELAEAKARAAIAKAEGRAPTAKEKV